MLPLWNFNVVELELCLWPATNPRIGYSAHALTTLRKGRASFTSGGTSTVGASPATTLLATGYVWGYRRGRLGLLGAVLLKGG